MGQAEQQISGESRSSMTNQKDASSPICEIRLANCFAMRFDFRCNTDGKKF